MQGLQKAQLSATYMPCEFEHGIITHRATRSSRLSVAGGTSTAGQERVLGTRGIGNASRAGPPPLLVEARLAFEGLGVRLGALESERQSSRQLPPLGLRSGTLPAGTERAEA